MGMAEAGQASSAQSQIREQAGEGAVILTTILILLGLAFCGLIGLMYWAADALHEFLGDEP